MVRLNRHQLTEAQLEDLFQQLHSVLGAQKTSGVILDELLGPEERVMVAKRLAIIILLIEGMSLYKISCHLKVSPATAQNLQQQLNAGNFETAVSQLGKSKRNYFAILTTLDSILHLGGMLPHYNGLDRYRGI